MVDSNDFKILKKIKKLERTKALFLSFTVIIGIITIIDIFVPDPILFLDEAALASLTGFFMFLCSNIDAKISDLKSGNNPHVNIQEVKEITTHLNDTASIVKKSRNK